MADNERLGASFSIDTTNLKAGLQQANRMIRESESEFKAAAAGMDDWTDSQEGLEARLKHLNKAQDLQRKKVEALKKQYKDAGYASDDMSAAAIKLRTDINKEQEALNKTQKELKQQEKALESLENQTEDTTKATEEMSKSFDGLKKVGKVAAGAIAGVATACLGAVSSFLALGESTKETQVEMAKLNGAFESAKLGGDAAQTSLYDLYGVLGDMGRSTEASVLLAKMSKDEDALQANTRILTGVFAEFGDSIPTEGLAEGMQATAEMGEVQGVLADALEWQGVNLDEYNEKLGTLSSAEERAAYIQETLTGLYGESADAYRENNKALIESNEAQLRMEETLANLGAIALPIMTMLKDLATDLLQEITPFVKLIGEGLTGALDGTAGAADKLAEGLSGIITALLDKVIAMLPFVIDTIVAVVPKLIEALLAQLPKLLDTIINAVVQIIEALAAMLPDIVEAIMKVIPLLVTNLIKAIPTLLKAAIQLLMAIVEALPTIRDELVAALPSIIEAIVDNLIEGIPMLIEAGAQLLAGLFKGMLDPKAIWEAVKTLGKSLVGGIKEFFGIHSPSRLMKDEIGKNLALGIGEGFEENIGKVNAEITRAMNFEDANVNVTAQRGGTAASGGVVVYQTNNYSQAHSQLELYKSKQATAAAVRLALGR